ncbi:hypothetical protein BDR05DRAFT_956293 [Suillus weaverae]|nr:hypothetical protein BDR05DRAFT_956293 [Suillus weaverae]
MNSIPIRFVPLSDIKLVGRKDMKKHLRGSVAPDRMMHYPWQIYDPSQNVKYDILSRRWLDEGEPTYEGTKNVHGSRSGIRESEKVS